MAQRIGQMVSLRPEMKERMNKFPEVNWSAIAQAAFEDELQRLEKPGNASSTLTLHQRILRLERKVFKK